MSTAGISSSSFFGSSPIAQFLAEFRQLGQDLQSGNLSAAQQDFVTLSSDVQSPAAPSSTAQPAAASTGTGTQSIESTLESDFQTLGQDLQSGNLSGAQQAYSQIQQAVQGSGDGFGQGLHGHHHDHGGGGESQIASILKSILGGSASTSSSSSSSSSSASNSTTSSTSATSATSSSQSTTASSGQSATVTLATLTQDFQAIGSALQSGSLSGAQQAFAQFTQDVSSFATAAVSPQPSWGGGDFGQFSGFGRAGSELWQAFVASQSATSATATTGSTIDTTA